MSPATPRRGERTSTAASTESNREQRRGVLLASVVIAVTLLVYAQVWIFGFVLLDDAIYVTGNPHVQAGLTRQSITWSLGTFHDANWLPLTWLSLMLDTEIYGGRPGGYHLTNVLLHSLNTGLVFAFLARATQKPARSAFVAALFALHPLHVESVAWIAERKDVLSTAFGLLSLLAYVRYATGGQRGHLVAAFVLFVCSLLSKATLVTLPCVFLLLDYWPLRRIVLTDRSQLQPAEPRRGMRMVAEKLPFLGVSIVFSVIAVIAQVRADAARPLTLVPLSTRCLNAVVAYAAYLEQALFPQKLAVFYPYPAAGLPWLVVATAAAVLVAISVAAIVWARRYPYLFVGWAWYLGTLVPMIGIVQVGNQQRADRYTCFPLIGLFLALTWLFCELVAAGARRKWILPVAAIAGLVALVPTTFIQIGYWHDSVALFQHALESTADNPFMRYSLGTALIEQGRLSEGIDELQAMVRMTPGEADSHYNLAVALQSAGRLQEAADEYRATLAIQERHADAHNNLGAIDYQRHEYAGARQHFLRAIEIHPEHARSYMNLAMLCVETKEFTEAISYAERGLELNPALGDFHRYMALALRGQGRFDEAVKQFQLLLSLSPQDTETRRELEQTRAMSRTGGPSNRAGSP